MNETIVSEGDTAGPGIGLAIAAAITGVIGGFMMLGAVVEGIVGLGIGAAVVLLIALGLAVGAAKVLGKVRRMDPGTLQVPATSFTLSSSAPARFRRRIKRGSRTVTSLTARLVLREWVRYTVGTDTRTDSRDLVERPIPIRLVPDFEGVGGDLQLDFPAYPPSFVGSNNKVQWLLIVDVTLDDGFTEDSVIPLWVVPAQISGGVS